MATEWAGVAAAYDRSFARLCAGTIPHLVAALAGGPAPRKALDVGTGTGVVAAALRDAGHEVTAIDAEPSMLDHAVSVHENIAFLLGALPDLPFADGAFDAAVANFVVNHLPQPRAAVRELARVTRPGGSVLVTIWPAAPVSAMNEMWDEVIERSGARRLAGLRLPAEDDFARTSEGLVDLMAEQGLERVTVAEVSWAFRISADDLWAGVDGGIGNIGLTYRAQGDSTRASMRQVYAELTRGTSDQVLELPTTALVASARVP